MLTPPEICRGPPQGEGTHAERLGARIKGNPSTSQAHSLSHLSSFLKLADLYRPIPSKCREPQSAVGLKPPSFSNPFIFYISAISELLCNCSAVSDCLQPQGLQHARLPCPSPSPGVCSNSYPLCLSERQPKIEATASPDAWVFLLALH